MLRSLRCIPVLFVTLWVIAGCTTESSPTPTFEESDRYLGQTPPGLEANLFAAGMISTDSAVEFSTSFTPDGTEFYFARRVEGEDNILYVSQWQDGDWSDPAPAPFAVGMNASEPHISFDNRTLYFSVFTGNTSAIWATDRTGEGWSEARLVGNGMFATSDQNGNFYVTDFSSGIPLIVQATLVDGQFSGVATITSGVHPVIAPDGSYLVYDDGSGNFKVRFLAEDETWGQEKALVSQGIPATASIGGITPDGKYFFFSNKKDIYWVSSDVITNLK